MKRKTACLNKIFQMGCCWRKKVNNVCVFSPQPVTQPLYKDNAFYLFDPLGRYKRVLDLSFGFFKNLLFGEKHFEAWVILASFYFQYRTSREVFHHQPLYHAERLLWFADWPSTLKSPYLNPSLLKQALLRNSNFGQITIYSQRKVIKSMERNFHVYTK